MLKIIKYPNEILTEQLPNFDFENPTEDPKQLEQEMFETLFSTEYGVGLAANQVGKRVRMFIMGHKSEPEKGTAFFNPIILANSDVLVDSEEGCLSFPNVYVKVKRPEGILAQWQNSSGEVQKGEFYGFDCRCFLHEFDHLEGIVYRDRISPLKWALAVKKSIKRKF